MTTARKIIKTGWTTTGKSRKPEWEQKYAGTVSDMATAENRPAIISQTVPR